MLDIKKTFVCANSQTAHILNKDMKSSQSEYLFSRRFLAA
jgi:hypothetical protein